MPKYLSYQNTVWTIVFDENTRIPLWVVDDIIINPDNLKIEAFIIKDSLFNEPKILNTASVPSWWKNIFVSGNSLREIKDTIVPRKILENWIWVIWKRVEDELWQKVWVVIDLNYTRNTYQWTSLIIKFSLFWLFYIWKQREILKKDIIDIKKEKIIIKNIRILKALN